MLTAACEGFLGSQGLGGGAWFTGKGDFPEERSLRMVAVPQAGKGILTPRQQGFRSTRTLERKVEFSWSAGC